MGEWERSTQILIGTAFTAFSGNCSDGSLSELDAFKSAGMVYPVELSCFLLQPNHWSKIGASAAAIPRTLTYKDDLDTWNPDKQKQIFWFINGANMTNGNKPIKTAAKYAGLPMGWTGLR